jgi:hypothetical protein
MKQRWRAVDVCLGKLEDHGSNLNEAKMFRTLRGVLDIDLIPCDIIDG